MNRWMLLAGAIATEVFGTMSLRATVDHSAWIPAVLFGYLASFGLLGLTLRAGLPIGVVYGIWGASGVALTGLLGAVIFGESLTTTAIIGIALIIVGVVLVQTGAPSRGGASAPEGAQ